MRQVSKKSRIKKRNGAKFLFIGNRGLAANCNYFLKGDLLSEIHSREKVTVLAWRRSVERKETNSLLLHRVTVATADAASTFFSSFFEARFFLLQFSTKCLLSEIGQRAQR